MPEQAGGSRLFYFQQVSAGMIQNEFSRMPGRLQPAVRLCDLVKRQDVLDLRHQDALGQPVGQKPRQLQLSFVPPIFVVIVK